MTYSEALCLVQDNVDKEAARFWLMHISGVSYAHLLLYPDKFIDEQVSLLYLEGLCKIQKGYPIAYLLGSTYFMGRLFQVSPEVLIPREDSQTMVYQAVSFLQARAEAHVLELGTGSGAIAITTYLLASAHIGAMYVTDVSSAALHIARQNALTFSVPLVGYVQDWYQSWCFPCTFDLIIANPPYIRDEDPYLTRLSYEPLSALVSEDCGLRDLSCIIEKSLPYLNVGGMLLCEHAWYQTSSVAEIFYQFGYSRIQAIRDESYKTILTVGYRH